MFQLKRHREVPAVTQQIKNQTALSQVAAEVLIQSSAWYSGLKNLALQCSCNLVPGLGTSTGQECGKKKKKERKEKGEKKKKKICIEEKRI